MNALDFATDLARETGELLLSYFGTDRTNTRRKADHTVVTDADMAADRLITERIQAAFPGDAIVSEELNNDYTKPADAVWVVDPLDGTSNFSQGLHAWGVSIARLVDGQPDTAALYFPKFDELYAAQRGHGATLNGERIEVAAPDDQHIKFIGFCSRAQKHYDINLPSYKPRIYGSAAYDFCLIARGLALVQFQSRPKVWDVAAGHLVAVEAGGVFHYLNDAVPWPLEPGKPYAKVSYPVIVAANNDVLNEVRSNIAPKVRA